MIPFSLPRLRPFPARVPRTTEPPTRPVGGTQLPLRLAGIVVLLAIGWRLADVTEWLFPFYTPVQYESALAARAIWFTADPAARTPERAAWFETIGFGHVVSPPLLPALVAGCYVLAGDEIPWVSKVPTALFWVGAGCLVFAAVVRQTGSHWAGLVALVWFTFTPYGLLVSRSFQTESVLAFGLALGVWCLSRLGRTLSWRETITAGVVCGLAALVKPGVLLPPLAAGFAALLLSPGVPGRLRRKVIHVVVFTGLLALPSVGYVKLWLNTRGAELHPGMLADPGFYVEVARLLQRVVGFPALGLGLIGAGLAARTRNYLLAGLFVGYAGYVGIFTYHCSTHGYYHTPLLVLVAVALGWPAAAVGRWLAAAGAATPRPQLVLAVVAILLFAGYLRATRLAIVGPLRYIQSVRTTRAETVARDRERDARYDAAREAVRPATRVVAVTEEYGYPLQFRTGLVAYTWPRRADTAAHVLHGAQNAESPADRHLVWLIAEGYQFVVVTDMTEFDGQPGLRAALDRYGHVMVSQAGLLVFDLRPATPPR